MIQEAEEIIRNAYQAYKLEEITYEQYLSVRDETLRYLAVMYELINERN